jgi:hypothetical protein
MARIVRGRHYPSSAKNMPAAEALGVNRRGILIRHIVPNLLGPVVIYMTLLVPQVIILKLPLLSRPRTGTRVELGCDISQGAKICHRPTDRHSLLLPHHHAVRAQFRRWPA